MVTKNNISAQTAGASRVTEIGQKTGQIRPARRSRSAQYWERWNSKHRQKIGHEIGH